MHRIVQPCMGRMDRQNPASLSFESKVWTAGSTRAGVPSQDEGMQCSLKGGTARLASFQSMQVCKWYQEGARGWGVGEGGEGRRAWRRELKDMSRMGGPTGHKWVG